MTAEDAKDAEKIWFSASSATSAVEKTMRKALFVLLVLAVPRVALACPVCFGQSDAPMAIATNLGIIFMLGIVVAVLAGFASFFIYLMRRAKLAAVDAPAQEGTAQC